jgi:Rieske Fe-S protein
LTTAPGLYVACGFNGWGISNGTAAGLLLAQQILGEAPAWGRIYDPMRTLPDNFNEGGDTQSLVDSVQDIPAGEGRVLAAADGKKLAVHRSPDGALHAVSAECTHKGCIVTWNNADGTWDCPCHGSVFAADGKVLHGPAVEALPCRSVPDRTS